ncbi:unnamed protein product [Ceutorhynchus assimilis]|uniref:Uncharacterized protein n=1 Tax=Ceutorhynchus assimilis TaxID=467358 RepID=A0A9N9QQ21_9CUCU|nr:unnamed protein product [Ceutorhynchus assimilis]
MPWRAQPGLLLLMAAVVAAVVLGAPCAACAPPCAPNIAPKQCLHFLQESHKDEVCSRDLSPGRRRTALANLRLRHCCEHQVAEALPEAAFHDTRTCRLLLQELLETDDLASQATCSHADLLLRYDCAQNYSIAFNCEHCKCTFALLGWRICRGHHLRRVFLGPILRCPRVALDFRLENG